MSLHGGTIRVLLDGVTIGGSGNGHTIGVGLRFSLVSSDLECGTIWENLLPAAILHSREG